MQRPLYIRSRARFLKIRYFKAICRRWRRVCCLRLWRAFLIHSGGRLRRYTARALAFGFGFGRCLCVGLPDSGSRRRWPLYHTAAADAFAFGRCWPPDSFRRAAFGLWRGALASALSDAAPLAASQKKLHQYFLWDSAPFRVERDFRTMQIVFYGDFVPMGYVCIVPLWGWGVI